VIYTTNFILQGSHIKNVKINYTFNLNGRNHCTQNFGESSPLKDWKKLER
jgi:hypothetical protein